MWSRDCGGVADELGRVLVGGGFVRAVVGAVDVGHGVADCGGGDEVVAEEVGD